MKSFLNDLERLVSIDCGSKNVAGVNAIGDIIQSHFDALGGWNTERVTLSECCGDMLYFTNKKGATEYDVAILCHMDTVYKDGTCEKHPPYLDGDKYHGAGASDMKSGCLGTIYALRDLSEDTLDQLSICVCYTPDEEIGALYSFERIEDLAKRSKYVLVSEAARPNGNLVKARKGNGKIRIEFFGKAAHAGSSLEKGVSAITEFAHWVHAINALVDHDKGLTLSVGIVEGGSGINVVPDYVEALVDLRFWRNEDGAMALDYLHNLAKTPFLSGCKVEVTRLAGRPSFEVVDGADKLMGVVKSSASDMGLSVDFTTGGGASDGNIAANVGTPTLDGFGPCGAGFHNIDREYLMVSSIGERIELFRRTIEGLAKLV